jgi:hypothetical protein
MTFVEPPRDSGRSIYERLGLNPSKPNRITRSAPHPIRSDRWKYAAGIVLLIAAALLWYTSGSSTSGTHPIYATYASPDEDQRRMAAQEAQMRVLEQKVEVLEIKVEALQKLSGYETLDGQRLPAVRDPLAGKH